MKSVFRNIAIGSFLMTVGIASSWAQDGGSEPMPRNTFAGQETLLTVCAKSAYPGGVNCAAPAGLGLTYTNVSLDAYLTETLGCSATTTSVYSCKANGLDGMVMYWIFVDTNEVSNVVYIPWQTI